MKKDGFTLIELLAVIVVLAIIALVSTPLVLNIIDKTQKKAALLSAQEYIDNVEEKMVYKMMDGSLLDKTEYDVSELASLVEIKGTKPTSGNLSIGEKGEVKKATLCVNNYNIVYENEKMEIDGKCDGTGGSEDKKEEAVSNAEKYIKDVQEKLKSGTSLGKGEHDVSELESFGIGGVKPSSGKVTVGEDGSIESAELCVNNYKVTYKDGKTSSDGTKCDLSIEEEKEEAVSNAEKYIKDVQEKLKGKTSLGKGEHDVSELGSLEIDGVKPSSGKVTVKEDGSIESAELCVNNYKVTYKDGKASSDGTKCDLGSGDDSGGGSSGGSGLGPSGESIAGGGASTGSTCETKTQRGSGKVYAIKRNVDAETSEWERLNDSEKLVAKATLDGTEVQNDFDCIYPWSDIITVNYSTSQNKVVAKYGEEGFDFTKTQVMTVIPEFWWKREQKVEDDGTYEYIYITDKATAGYTHSEEFMIGRYPVSTPTNAYGGILNSKSEVPSFAGETVGNMRIVAKKIGEGWGLMDYHYFLIQLLYLVEYADYDSQKVLGEGQVRVSDWSGGCDNLGMKSGSIVNDGGHSMIYRGIEDIYGNVSQFVDGINIKDRKAYVCTNPSEYDSDIFEGCYKPLSYINSSANVHISKLGYDPDNPLFAFPTEGLPSANTYIPDMYYQNSGERIAFVGGNTKSYDSSGLWNWDLNRVISFKDNYFGARLIKYK